ncbi:polysaccharide pyruvyl transferase family protein [Akkermansiaceae bacterium]|nr:polysaccharide pyruvyl transferase family protein [Akkermansiaceae bacterium]
MSNDEKKDTLHQSGVLTLHYGYNEGAVLQAMATCQLLDQLGHEAEVVDHRYPAKQAIYGKTKTNREKAILSAVNEWLPLSPERFESQSQEPTMAYASQRYESLVVGSDVVWALKYVGRLRRFFKNGIFRRQCDPFFPAFPNVYWPGESVSCRKIAFAASCGNLDPSEIPGGELRKMAGILDGFRSLSVRDHKTLALVNACSPELASRTELVPDPTIALNLLQKFDGSSGLEKLQSQGFQEDSNWALLVMKEGPASRAALEELKRRGYQVAASGSYGGKADINLSNCGLSPLEWGWVPRCFQLNITERMHSLIFTVLNHTPVLALDMNTRSTTGDTKVKERIDAFGLGDCYLHQEDASESAISKSIDQALNKSYSWNKIDENISRERQGGVTFLRSALSL